MRRQTQHTQRAHRQDVMDFVSFLGIRRPDDSSQLFKLSIAEERKKVVAELEATRPATLGKSVQGGFLGVLPLDASQLVTIW
jgi:hypothetical protein